MLGRIRFAAGVLALAAVSGRALAADTAPRVLAYRFSQGQTLRYKLVADIKGSIPLFDNPTPSPIHGVITVVYLATPKAALADGTTDVELKVDTADVTLEDVPMPIPMDQVEQVLNQTVTLDSTGKVLKVQSQDASPLGLSIPGVDPKRLYAALFPIVFQTKPVAIGDQWGFKSELLGSDGVASTFTARVLSPTGPVPAAPTGTKPPKAAKKLVQTPPTAAPALLEARENQTRLSESFTMPVAQQLGKNKKPVTSENPLYKTRKGSITGSGVYLFDHEKGLFTTGVVNISASILDTLAQAPKDPDEPKNVKTTVNARVTVELLPADKDAAK